ncbi:MULTISPECIES: ABC transporter permease [Streptomyces]|jgi:ABC-type multidrug transport system, permease component|uniref:Transport permease protein n=2 Tax=Streptomyces TaxID=1883 RepID=A0A1D8G7U6_9ACTN|nr:MULTISPECIES: ABC transporter permease [Streptomyces]AOT61531.1 Daunorubicin/doxorubicin resistance ABC transporter permease protein DrrB [Streptomyces rubrolavendulae]KAF0649371.1 ABC transporter [Streptomyces fradiae ATCC 10745 = DSM 40063]OSY49013.1 Daunorubicin/doxorubicin resistance ABC transporter permease protein DrrB [Streptomyces fradiae ATCC 10745 = DSM 40063]QEV14482.1 ABC transporter permease [Streptomyces fradiae ATCC 10745 = DSM 40063]UQS30262.1 ABC transporter permease [Strep
MSAVVDPAASPRIGPVRGFRHGLTLAARNIRYIVRSPATLVDTIIQPVLFLVVFALLFGGEIAGDWQAYLQPLVPGLMVQIILYASAGTGLALNTDVVKGVFDRFRSLPIARSAPLVGAVIGDVVRYALALVVLLALAFAMGFRVRTGPVEVLLAMVLTIGFGLTMCWLSVLIGMAAKSPQAVPGITMALVLPLTFGSNIFASPDTMPDWLRWWVGVNPVSHFVDATRALTLGGEASGPVMTSLIWMAVLFAVLFPLAVRTYARRTR